MLWLILSVVFGVLAILLESLNPDPTLEQQILWYEEKIADYKLTKRVSLETIERMERNLNELKKLKDNIDLANLRQREYIEQTQLQDQVDLQRLKEKYKLK